MKKALAVAVVALGLTAVVPAHAEQQTIDASIASAVSMTASPTSTISSWTLASSGANTTSGGSMTVSANGPYTVTVSADKTRMSEWNGTGYVVGGKALTSALAVIPTRTGGTAPTAATLSTATLGTSTGLVVGTGLGTDIFDLTLSQPTAITDSALVAGRTYHMVLTYTASGSL